MYRRGAAGRGRGLIEQGGSPCERISPRGTGQGIEGPWPDDDPDLRPGSFSVPCIHGDLIRTIVFLGQALDKEAVTKRP